MISVGLKITKFLKLCQVVQVTLAGKLTGVRSDIRCKVLEALSTVLNTFFYVEVLPASFILQSDLRLHHFNLRSLYLQSLQCLPI